MGNRVKYKKNGEMFEPVRKFKSKDGHPVDVKISETKDSRFKWSVECGEYVAVGLNGTRIKAMKAVRKNLEHLQVGLIKEEKPYRKRKLQTNVMQDVKRNSGASTGGFSWED